MVHEKNQKYKLRILVNTVSTSRTLETDETGKLLQNLFQDNQHDVSRVICKDDENEIKLSLRSNSNYNVYIFVGGTGPSRRDVTVETIRKISGKEIIGFGELFRSKSNDMFAYISNASLFINGKKQIYCIPGSPEAVTVSFPIISSFMNHLHHELIKE